MSVLLAVTGWNPAPWIEAFRRVAPERTLFLPGDACDPASIRYALVWKPEAGRLARLPNLEVIFSLGAGVDHLTSDHELPDLPVVRIVDADLTRRMTEWVVMEVLLHHRQHGAYAAAQAAGEWRQRRQWPAREVRVGVMGLGVLGLDAVRALRALDFSVAGWSRTAKTIDGVPTWAGAAGLDAFLARTDILVSLLPLTTETERLIDASLIDRLAKDGPLGGPVLINAGRGRSQIDADIDAALRDGRLKGASLDVFAVEPLPAANPLWTAPNLYLTPHVAAESDPVALSAYVAAMIDAHERGESLTNLVDRRLGY
jgi:glyoxylate/hydroxypyruvate reductase A